MPGVPGVPSSLLVHQSHGSRLTVTSRCHAVIKLSSVLVTVCRSAAGGHRGAVRAGAVERSRAPRGSAGTTQPPAHGEPSWGRASCRKGDAGRYLPACQRRVFAGSAALPEGAVGKSLVPPGESHTHSSRALGSAPPASPASPWCRTCCEMLHASINFSYCMVPAPQLLGAEGPQQGQQHPPPPCRCCPQGHQGPSTPPGHQPPLQGSPLASLPQHHHLRCSMPQHLQTRVISWLRPIEKFLQVGFSLDVLPVPQHRS